MKITNFSAAKLVGYSFFAILVYVVLAISLMSLAFYLNTARSVFDVWPVNLYQQYIYSRTTRNIWQYQKQCISADPDLIYAPATGACEFSNIEFDTVLNFDGNGRFVPARAGEGTHVTTAPPGIAILGDSHAMGWGVNDADTFANVLQSGTDKPVYNLAVSSYGTQRELRRLMLSPILDQIDTVIIQYCDNDMGENTARIDFEAEAEKFAATLKGRIEPSKRTTANHLAAILTTHALRKALTLPFRPIRELIRKALGRKGKDFSPHFGALQAVLSEYEPILADKKVVIFYSNAHGNKFDNFEEFSVNGLDDVTLVDLAIPRDRYFAVDDHLTADGHRFVGQKLSELIH